LTSHTPIVSFQLVDIPQQKEQFMTTIPASHHDLLQSPVATFATIGPDGRPQLSEIWFLADGDSISLSLNTSRQKTKNILARPACCLFILDIADPQRYLEIRGDAEVSADADHAFVDRVGKKYGVNLRDYDQPGDERVVVRIIPHRVNAVNMGG
jgi:PPOX class probable F420-dependent enzyme